MNDSPLNNSLLNKSPLNKSPLKNADSSTRILATAFATLLITSCAQAPLVIMEAPVTQLNNLNDYDSDGVIKARDKCAETVLGATIDNYGCGRQTSSLEPLNVNIKFANNSYDIPDTAYPKIQELAGFLDKHQELNVLIEGHTSKTGDIALNQALSDNRAKAVAHMLKDNFNIAKTRVSSVGYGFTRLEITGDNPAAHAINRRIMAELTYTEHVDDMMWTIYTVDQMK